MMKNMFLVENNVPDVYVNESRDFQLISRLFDLVFQSTRFSIDSMKYISDTKYCNNTLLPLLDSKVGFHTNLNLSDRTHRKILDAFPYIIRHKGSFIGVELVLNLFRRITGVLVTAELTDNPNEVLIIFEDNFYDFNILCELLEYIRPVGLLFIYKKRVTIPSNIDTYVTAKPVVGAAMEYVSTGDMSPRGVVIETAVPSGKEDESYDQVVASNVGFTQISWRDHESDITRAEDNT